MKNYLFLLNTVLCICLISSCLKPQNAQNTPATSQKDSLNRVDSPAQIVAKKDSIPKILPEKSHNLILKGNYLGSECEGNYVCGGAMNLAWNELNDNILHGKLQLSSTDKTALKMVNS